MPAGAARRPRRPPWRGWTPSSPASRPARRPHELATKGWVTQQWLHFLAALPEGLSDRTIRRARRGVRISPRRGNCGDPLRLVPRARSPPVTSRPTRRSSVSRCASAGASSSRPLYAELGEERPRASSWARDDLRQGAPRLSRGQPRLDRRAPEVEAPAPRRRALIGDAAPEAQPARRSTTLPSGRPLARWRRPAATSSKAKTRSTTGRRRPSASRGTAKRGRRSPARPSRSRRRGRSTEPTTREPAPEDEAEVDLGPRGRPSGRRGPAGRAPPARRANGGSSVAPPTRSSTRSTPRPCVASTDRFAEARLRASISSSAPSARRALEPLALARRGEDPRAELAGELDGEGPDTRRRAGDQDRLARAAARPRRPGSSRR